MKPVLHLPSEIYVGVSPIWLCRAKVIDTRSLAYNRSTSYCSRWVGTRWGRSGFHWLYVRCRRGPMCTAAGICSTTEEITQKITKNTRYLTLDPWKTLLQFCKCWLRRDIDITSRAQQHSDFVDKFWVSVWASVWLISYLDMKFLLGNPRSRPHLHYPTWWHCSIGHAIPADFPSTT